MRDPLRQRTESVFGGLWGRYDEGLFDESVALFKSRFLANGFDMGWFGGKRCLDAGCGGGRYALAMLRAGASHVVACDIALEGLFDAKRRAAPTLQLTLQRASVLDLPYADESFDFVCCSGVLHHTPNPRRGLHEISRVLRRGGRLYLLLYGKGGLRWPTILQIRPHAQAIGYELMDEAMRRLELPANKQRTFLDDLFVPLIDFYAWDEVEAILQCAGFRAYERWEKGKLDHEESVEVQRNELIQLRDLFASITASDDARFDAKADSAGGALAAVQQAVDGLDQIEEAFAVGEIDEDQRRWEVFGWEHHRVLGEKG